MATLKEVAGEGNLPLLCDVCGPAELNSLANVAAHNPVIAKEVITLMLVHAQRFEARAAE
ncbi:MAG TPA: hypothetical protein VJZ94_03850 [Candidatus Paceibacterota bacterium]|nr:hypothetical protein [Candidatus Paceibacterota bacterium]